MPSDTQDLFNFRDYVLFLKDKLDNTKYSEVVGVHGDYGAGKTTTMNILKQLYGEDNGTNNILEFSAWRNYYNKENSVWKALLYELAGKIITIFDELKEKEIGFNIEGIKLNYENGEKFLKKLKKDGFLESKLSFKSFKNSNDFLNDILYDYIKLSCLEIQYNLYQDLKDFDGELKKGKSEIAKHPFIGIGKIGLKTIKETKELTELFLSGGLSGIIGKIFAKNSDGNKSDEGKEKSLFDLFKEEEQELKKVKIDSLEVIQRKFDILLKLYNLIHFTDEKNQKPLIIMIDDLDRILPEKSVEILEILRIFFEKSQKIHFICAIDIRVIEKGIERKFNQLNKGGDLSRIEFEEYLEKIITIPFDLPAIPLVDFDTENNIFGIDTLIDNEFKNIEIKEGEIEKNLKTFITDKNFKNKTIIEINYFLNSLNIKKEYIKKSDSYKSIINKLKEEENKLIESISIDYLSYFNEINTKNDFKDIIKTGLQANPRKIKRFINVFEIYFKILIYRNKKYNSNLLNYNSDSIYLAKMLIIKLEWDEIYKEFIKDKFFIGFLEQLARLESGKGTSEEEDKDEFVVSYNLTKFIKESKTYKLQNLYGMLSIKEYFWNSTKIGGELINIKKGINAYLGNIYKVYYLINNKFNEAYFSNNENLENIYKYNLIKYLYLKDEVRANNYIKIFTLLSKDEKTKKSRVENAKKIINFYKGYTEEKEKEKVNLNNLIYNNGKND